jgi:NitT/TauT family transport system substrate-binding protein
MHGSRRRFLTVAASGLVAARIGPRPARAQAVVKIGTAVLGDYAMVGPVIVALEKGHFKRSGIDAELVPFRGGPDLLKAVIGGEILVGLTGATDILVFREAGAPIKMIAAQTSGNHFTLNVAPDIQRATELRGKSIGVTKIGSTTWVFARLLARQHGWNPERDVTIVPLGGLDAQVAALSRKEIHAFVWGDGGAVLEAQGRSKVLERLDTVTPGWISQLVYASEDGIRTRPDDIRRALRGLFRAIQFMRQNPEQAATIASRTLKWDPKAVLIAHRLSGPLLSKDGTIDSKALGTMQDALLELGVLSRRLPLQEHYTTAFTPVTI